MSKPVAVYDVFGFMHGDDEHLDHASRGVPEWRLVDAIRYFTMRGYDKVLIERRDVDTRFDPPPMLDLPSSG